LTEKIKKKGGAGLVGVKTNLIDIIWGDGRPAKPQEKVKPLSIEFTGKKSEEKIEDLRKELEKKSAGLIICACSFLSSNRNLADCSAKPCWMRLPGFSIFEDPSTRSSFYLLDLLAKP